MNPQLFHDLAASEEASSYPENARALRAVPEMAKVLRQVDEELTKLQGFGIFDGRPGLIACRLNARAALASMDATTTEKETES